jgi:hypothetical protein
MDLKTGALTAPELLTLWEGAMDPEFVRPMLAAGEGRGLEVHTQAQAQLARVSEAIDRTTQAMFIRPWSGQTNPPASGEAKARVRLTFTRSTRFELPIWLRAGEMFVAHVETDWSPNGSKEVRTGLRYRLDEDVVLEPGEPGPVHAWAVAEYAGVSFNWPVANTITAIEQPGAGLENINATLIAGLLLRMTTPNRPDTLVPSNVGSYVGMVGGANAAKAYRIKRFFGPDFTVTPPLGSSAELERLIVFTTSAFTGSINVGDVITNAAGPLTATARVLRVRAELGQLRITAVVTAYAVGAFVSGANFAAPTGTLTLDHVLHLDDVVPTATQSWRVLGWDELGVSVHNETKPSGGCIGMLDMLGEERGLARHPGELDADYSLRIWDVPDAVSPNAITRALYRLLGSLPWCVEEAGQELRGFFYDGDATGPHALPMQNANDAYDAVVAEFAVAGINPVGTEVFVMNAVNVRHAARGVVISVGLSVTRVALRFGVPPTTGLLVRVGAPLIAGDAYSSVALLTGGQTRRNRTYLDTAQFRGFFQVCLPALSIQEHGVAFDTGGHDAFDVAPAVNLTTAFDGGPIGNAAVYGGVRRAIDNAHAAGVLFALVQNCETC